MAYDSTFTPQGPTVLVGTTPVQCPPVMGLPRTTSYRISNITSGLKYLGWLPSNPTAPATINTAAPAAGAPSANVIGIQANAVETLCLPPEAWFQASAAASFEITPGEGM